MTEDEAFIRAVVDGPGDDTPRLVYADWLDDRADPRGPYLRAEADALRRFRQTGDFQSLLTWLAGYPPLAAGLDTVWVARVSRPPVGVCCDHVRFTDCGPEVAVKDLDDVERGFAGKLSPDHRGFLMNYNGGRPDPPGVPAPRRGEGGATHLVVGAFLAVSHGGEPQPVSIEYQWRFLRQMYEIRGHTGPNTLVAGMIPLADTRPDHGYLLVGIAESNRGKVFRFENCGRRLTDPTALTELSPTLPEFLALMCAFPDE